MSVQHRSHPLRRSPRHLVRGLTLIELMVALAVFAVLGTLTYRGTSQMLASHSAIERELTRWREIGRALHIIESELMQVVAPSLHADNPDAQPLRWPGAGGNRELEVLGMAGGGMIERIAFRHIDNRIDWVRRADALPDAPIETDVLIEQVAGLSVRFLADGRWFDTWPRTGSSAALPRAVEIRLDLPDQGAITRLYALR
jgi:general secretion pathway protein J